MARGLEVAKMAGDENNRPPFGLGLGHGGKAGTGHRHLRHPFTKCRVRIIFDQGAAKIVADAARDGAAFIGRHFGINQRQLVFGALAVSGKRGDDLFNRPAQKPQPHIVRQHERRADQATQEQVGKPLAPRSLRGRCVAGVAHENRA